jgi:hypothetical protein
MIEHVNVTDYEVYYPIATVPVTLVLGHIGKNAIDTSSIMF